MPFPEQIASLPDADLLDLSVSVHSGAAQGVVAHVRAQARYATSARVSQVRDFYLGELDNAGATLVEPVVGRNGAEVIDAVLNDEAKTTLRVRIDPSRGYRSVKVSAHYGGFDHREIFARFARWHNGDVPVAHMSEPTGVEISTFTSGRGPSTLVLYSTHYDCQKISRSERRAIVDDRMLELGWTYVEPREGIMFIQDGLFDAETHVDGDDSSSTVTFVGEFSLR